MTTDAAILEQLRGAWNRPAEEPTAVEEPIPRGPRSGRQEADRLASATLERINAACPPNWKPTAEDWQRIDRAEATIDEARRRDDRPGLLAALTDYESIAVEIFASATNTPPMAAADDKLTETLLCTFDDPPDIPAPKPLLLCFDRYGHQNAWQSIYGPHLICAVCHPPVEPDIVTETIELDDHGQRVT